MSENVVISCVDRVMTLELARTDKKNALTKDMYRSLSVAMHEADADPDVRVILIHGQEDCFTAGNDLSDFLDPEDSLDDMGAGNFISVIPTVKTPIVAAVGGPAVGIGTTMLLHCDIVFAATNARFVLPFINLAVVPEAASTMLLPKLAGHQKACELLLLGEPFDANVALALGLATRVVEPSELLSSARAMAKTLASKPPAAMLATKALLKREPETVLQRIQEENAVFETRLASPEAQEAMSAFFEKRKPDFSKF